jgi:hypothetical protein
MDNSLYDKCGCGATKLTVKERCTNCWLNSKNDSWLVESNRAVDHPRTSQSRVNTSTNSNSTKTNHSTPYFGSETFVRQPTTSQNSNGVCKVCQVQISKTKEYCKACRRDRERGQIKTALPQTYSATASNSLSVCKGCNITLTRRKNYCTSCRKSNLSVSSSEPTNKHQKTSQNSNGVCKVCQVQISKTKEYCKACRRDRERGQIKTNLPPTKRKCIENNCDADAIPDSRRCESHYVSCKHPLCNNEVKWYANGRYCDSHEFHYEEPSLNSKPSVKTSRENQDSVVFPCRICGKDNTGGRIAKGVGKTIGNTAMGVFGAAAILTGGLAGLALVAYGAGAARISGIAENYSICAECRAK